MKIETKFDIGDIVYKANNTGESIQYNIQNITIYENHNEYSCTNCTTKITHRFNEDELFLSKTDCEKDYVLKKFGHLFKDAKTLK